MGPDPPLTSTFEAPRRAQVPCEAESLQLPDPEVGDAATLSIIKLVQRTRPASAVALKEKPVSA